MIEQGDFKTITLTEDGLEGRDIDYQSPLQVAGHPPVLTIQFGALALGPWLLTNTHTSEANDVLSSAQPSQTC